MTDPLSPEEREALTRLRQHEGEIDGVREEIEGLRKASQPGITDLRRVDETATRVEQVLQVKDASVLAQVAWPVADIAQIRGILQMIDKCESSSQKARARIDGQGDPGCVDDLVALLESFRRLGEANRELHADPTKFLGHLDLMIEGRARAIGPLCDALLDQAIEHRRALRQQGDLGGALLLEERLQKFLSQNWVISALAKMDVEVPGPDALPPLATTANAPEAAAQASAAPAPAANSTADHNQYLHPNVGGSGPKGSGLSSSGPEPEPSPVPQIPCEEREDQRSQQRMWVSQGPPESLGPVAGQDNSSQQRAQNQMQNQSMDITFSGNSNNVSDGLQQTTELPGDRSRAKNEMGHETGCAELWHAVHVGDEQAIRRMIGSGDCNARMRDASGHSVLWHALAFGHNSIAQLMLDKFPPGMDGGVDIAEVHYKRHDSLLHLMCSGRTFGEGEAALFRKLCELAPPGLMEQRNTTGASFFHLAAQSLNFWVLRLVLRTHPKSAKTLVCMPSKPAAMQCVADSISPPVAAEFVQPAPLPGHLRLSDMLSKDPSTGQVPYADVAFDVGPDGAGARFFAHRVIVAAHSQVLFEELQKEPMKDLPNENLKVCIHRVDQRIPKEVWRCVLQFMYSGVINCDFGDKPGPLVELLRACALYKLPKPLVDFVQAKLHGIIPSSEPKVALNIFSICAGSMASDLNLTPVRQAAAYILLRSAHKLFEDFAASDMSTVLEKVLETAEQVVFDPAAMQQAAAAHQAAAAQQTAAAQQAAQMAAAAQAQASQGPSQAQQMAMAQAVAAQKGKGKGMGKGDPMDPMMHSMDPMMQSMDPRMMQQSRDAMMQSMDPRMQQAMMQEAMMQQSRDAMMQSREAMMQQSMDAREYYTAMQQAAMMQQAAAQKGYPQGKGQY